MRLNWNFQRGEGPSVREVWIFCGTTQWPFNSKRYAHVKITGTKNKTDHLKQQCTSNDHEEYYRIFYSELHGLFGSLKQGATQTSFTELLLKCAA